MNVPLPTQVPCPQCGALLTPPVEVETWTCPWCASTLRPADGVRVYQLVESPRVDRAAAAQSVLAWFTGPEMPRGISDDARMDVGELRYFPFLRVRGLEGETVVPLAALPLPDVAAVAHVPADLGPVLAPGADGRQAAREGGPASSTAPAMPALPEPDDAILRSLLRVAAAERGTRELMVEYRAYFPLRYSYRGERYTGIVDASAAGVHAARRPARREVSREWLVALVVVSPLAVEALLIPWFWIAVAAIVVSAPATYVLARQVVVRYG